MNNETKHRIFVDKLVTEIHYLAEHCFHPEVDVEVCWKLFREQLRHHKREHQISYMKYLETDCED